MMPSMRMIWTETSRQKRQFEKVIIPILWEIHRTNVLQKLSLCSAEDILRFLDWFRDLLKIEHFAWTIYNKWILLDCSRVCKNLTNGQNLLKFWHNISALLFEMFLLYISLIYLLIYRSYDAFNADDMDWNLSAKTSIWKGHNSYYLRNT